MFIYLDKPRVYGDSQGLKINLFAAVAAAPLIFNSPAKRGDYGKPFYVEEGP